MIGQSLIAKLRSILTCWSCPEYWSDPENSPATYPRMCRIARRYREAAA